MGIHEDTSVHENAVTRRKLLSRRFYVLQALFILLAMSISLASLVWFARFGGSLWWLVAADLLLLAACYQALASLLETVAPLIAALDMPDATTERAFPFHEVFGRELRTVRQKDKNQPCRLSAPRCAANALKVDA
ncbi:MULTISPECIES: hypothetical protein [unclassified Shinella]|uniref:hypothetical protein n=1 Tax=unclassified Shinella TaxID=2643062 RepID=UPI00225C9AD4|nr:hypothetical protein [Shinella sp. YE25]MDC7259416.1 hypothetical protein [Shinella sp. YE25]CAI0341432.1 hypothetical protein SHINE37_70237 [Rhizobiaceae bacterium]CAK7261065.1 protein of unknown function [Shinella sp. WSC3-e]